MIIVYAFIAVGSGLVAKLLFDLQTWISVAIGVSSGVLTTVIGIYTIREKRLDIQIKKTQARQLDRRIVIATEEEISRYSGERYQKITKRAKAIITETEYLPTKQFIMGSEDLGSSGKSTKGER